MSSRFRLPRLAAALVLAGAAALAHAVPVARSGTFVFNTDVVRVAFSLAAAAPVSIWTDSWQAGLNVDPTLSVFDAASSRLVATGDDTPDPARLHAGQGGYDGSLDFASLAAGSYLLTLSASGNDPVGPLLSNGFSLQGTTPIPVADWNQPSYDVNKSDQKGGFWRVQIDGATTVAAVPAVPEPSTWASMLGGLIAAAVLVGRRTTGR